MGFHGRTLGSLALTGNHAYKHGMGSTINDVVHAPHPTNIARHTVTSTTRRSRRPPPRTSSARSAPTPAARSLPSSSNRSWARAASSSRPRTTSSASPRLPATTGRADRRRGPDRLRPDRRVLGGRSRRRRAGHPDSGERDRQRLPRRVHRVGRDRGRVRVRRPPLDVRRQPVSCAAALATIDRLEDDVIANARDQGEWLAEHLGVLADEYDVVGDVRGRGLMWASRSSLPTSAVPAPRTSRRRRRNAPPPSPTISAKGADRRRRRRLPQERRAPPAAAVDLPRATGARTRGATSRCRCEPIACRRTRQRPSSSKRCERRRAARAAYSPTSAARISPSRSSKRSSSAPASRVPTSTTSCGSRPAACRTGEQPRASRRDARRPRVGPRRDDQPVVCLLRGGDRPRRRRRRERPAALSSRRRRRKHESGRHRG